MIRLRSVLLLTLLTAGCAATAYGPDDPFESTEDALSSAGLDRGQARSLKTAGLEEQAEWFQTTPFSSAGIPMLLFRAFPDFAPEIWGNTVEDLPHLGLPRNEMDERSHALALGLGFQRSAKALIPGTEGTPLDVTSFQVVGLTCGACHISRMRMPNGQLKFLLGNGNTQFDPNAFGEAVYRTVTRPDFTGEKFRELVWRKQEELSFLTPYAWEFNTDDPRWRAQQDLEVSLFMNTLTKVKDPVTGEKRPLSDVMVDTVKRRVLDRQGTIDAALGPLYGAEVARLHGGTPGQADAIGKAAVISGTHALTAAVVDLPAVWRQDTREYAQYDGTIRDPFFRNLGATMGVSGNVANEANRTPGCRGPIQDCTDQHDLNTANAYFTASFVTRLEAPKYPFAVDRTRAARGEALFAKHCASCHSMPEGWSRAITPRTVRVPLTEDIGADPQRARQLDSDGIGKVAAQLKRACKDGDRVQGPISVPESACDVDPKEILFDSTSNPGYVGQALTGIWATAPYLHNGSVPNLRALLVPSLRPAKFWRGNLSYDTKNLGWVNAREPGVSTSAVYDTSLFGNSNLGHSAPVMLGDKDWGADPAALDDLLEYLKTL